MCDRVLWTQQNLLMAVFRQFWIRNILRQLPRGRFNGLKVIMAHLVT
jgi:hypothetical protein